MNVQIPTTEYPSFEIMVAEMLASNTDAEEGAALFKSIYAALPENLAQQVADAVAERRERQTPA